MACEVWPVYGDGKHWVGQYLANSNRVNAVLVTPGKKNDIFGLEYAVFN